MKDIVSSMSEAQKEAYGYVLEGMRIEDACELADLGTLERSYEMFRLAEIKYERSLLSLLNEAIQSQIEGGKANHNALVWLLERRFPKKYGKGLEEAGKDGINIKICSGKEDDLNVEVAGKTVRFLPESDEFFEDED